MKNMLTRRDFLKRTIQVSASFSFFPLLSDLQTNEITHHTTKTLKGAKEMKEDLEKLKKRGYVLVTPEGPEDGGDFGPKTDGTQTSGIQEALDYAKANKKDFYIAGGGLTEAFKGGVGYQLEETLRIPWKAVYRR